MSTAKPEHHRIASLYLRSLRISVPIPERQRPNPTTSHSSYLVQTPRLAVRRGSAIRFLQHPNQHRSERLVLLAVDQELGEGPRLGVPVELTDLVGPLEVGEHQDVEKLRAGNGTEGVETLAQDPFELLEVQGDDAAARFPVDLVRG
jgi:hypothetical protein